MSRPLAAVLDAFGSGASSLAEIESATALDHDVVTAAVDHLVRAGRLEAKILTVGCPAGGCGGCALASSEGAARLHPRGRGCLDAGGWSRCRCGPTSADPAVGGLAGGDHE